MKKTMVVAVSVLGFTALSVVGKVSPLAGAGPCSDWELNGPVTIAHSDGVTVKINKWDGIYADDGGGGAQLFLADGTAAYEDSEGYPIGHYRYTPGNNAPYDAPSLETGTAYGGITKGGTNFDMTIVWDGKDNRAGSNRYLGTVDPSGVASGTDTNSQNHITTNWHMVEHFTCAS
jgi:hypothetical protein